MSKMKQATLFSLKNWNKITPEEIMKHKDILDNSAGIETILKTLNTLKNRNPTKDLILSTGINASLKKMMTEHQTSLVTNEVKKLLIHWKLDESFKNLNIAVEKEKPSLVVKNFKDISNVVKETIVVNKKSEPLNKIENVTKLSETHPKDEELSILKVCVKFDEKKKECKTNTADQIYKIQTEKVIRKKPLVSDFRKTEINRRLQSAMNLFMEELGKQEVKTYLDALALKFCDY